LYSENFEARMIAAAADEYSEYAKRRLDVLVEKAEAFYESQQPPEQSTPPPPSASVENFQTTAEEDILASRSAADREAIASLVTLASSYQGSSSLRSSEEPPNKINLLVDQLLANAPQETPHASNELDSLRALQELISRRIESLDPRPADTD
jgi:hypothetical protein